MRVRSRAPRALLLWLAYSLRMFLASSIKAAIRTRKISTMTPVKTSVSPEVSGLRKPMFVVLNAFNATNRATTRKKPVASRAMDRRRGSPRNDMGRL